MAKYAKLLPLLIALVLLARVPAGVSAQVETTVSFSSTSYTVNEGEGNVTVTVTISTSVSYEVSVQLRTSDGTAVSGRDYSGVSTIVLFPADTTSQTVSVAIFDDETLEVLRESFSVSLSNHLSDSRLGVDTTAITVEIVDDDSATVRLERYSYMISEDQELVEICAVMPERTEIPTTVRLSTKSETATSPEDYTSVSTDITFEVGSGERRCVAFPIVDDDTVEYTETFRVQLERTPTLDLRVILGLTETITEMMLDLTETTVTVLDTDTADISFHTDRITIDEGESFDLTVELGGDPTCPIGYDIDYPIALGAPSQALSAFSTIPRLVTFKSCETSQTISVNTADIAATAELRFALPSIVPRVIVQEPSAATVFVIDTGRTSAAIESPADAGNTSQWGIWSDGATMWVADMDDSKIYAYNLSTGQRDAPRDFDTLSEAGNSEPIGMWSNGTTLWVANNAQFGVGDDKIFAYNMATKQWDTDKDFDNVATNTPLGIWSDGTTMWVVSFSSARLLAFNADDQQRDTERDLDVLSSATNDYPLGIWSDGIAMWVSDYADEKVYAYNLATNERSVEKELDGILAAGQRQPAGLWSNGTIMWVASASHGKIYAYYFPVEPVVRAPVRRSTTSTIDTSESDETDPARPSTVQTDRCVADIVDPDGGRVELGDTITDRWVSGCPSITRGGRLAKYYTFNLPITTAVEIALDSHLDDYLVLRSGGLTGSIVEQDDDDGPGNNSLIDKILTAGKYTIEATTFYADGVEADFTLSVMAVPRILYDGPVSDVAREDYAPDGPTMTVKLLPTLPIGTLEVTVEDADGFGEGAGPLGGAQADGGSAGTVMLALPKPAWVEYGGIHVEARKSGAWSPHTQADEQAMLTRHSPRSDLSPVLLGLIQLIGKTEGALQLLQSLTGLPSFSATPTTIELDESILDAILRRSYANCVAQVTVPWLVEADDTTGVRISVPVALADADYLSLAASFVANGGQPALAQLHDLLATCDDAPACQQP